MTTRRLTVGAGWSMVAIALLHTLVFLPHPYWGEWLTGGLHGGAATAESYSTFWALPGGFVAPLLLLGLLVVRMGRRGERAPAYMGWVVGCWVVGCVLLIGPSGFLTGLVPAGLLIAADVSARRGASRREGPVPARH
jgi:hypothetical protein